MSDSAELLVLMHDADQRVSSFEGEFEDWGVPSPSNVLVVERNDEDGGRIRLRAQGPGLYPKSDRRRRRIWFESPQRLRVELLRAETVVRVGVRNGTRWWRWDRNRGTTSGDLSINPTLPAMFDLALLSPARLLAWLRFEQIGEGVRLDRRVLLARAVPRDSTGDSQLVLESELDAEYGTILRWAVFEDSRCVGVTEALEARFEIAVSPERFVFAPA